jgi:hypothetical protein
MKNELVKRLVTDYSNNILQNYITSQEKLKAFANDKTGNHIPFSWIYNQYSRICERTNELLINENNTEEIETLAYSLELIVNALISKLYVHGVFDTLPKELISDDINMEDYGTQEKCFIKFKSLQHLFNCFSNNGRRLRVTVDEEVLSQEVYLVENGAYIWELMIIALILNTLSHGYENSEGYINCKIYLLSKNRRPNAIRVENHYQKQAYNMQDGITKVAIVNFFRKLSDIEDLVIHDEEPVEEQPASIDTGQKLFYYRVDIPITNKREGN